MHEDFRAMFVRIADKSSVTQKTRIIKLNILRNLPGSFTILKLLKIGDVFIANAKIFYVRDSRVVPLQFLHVRVYDSRGASARPLALQQIIRVRVSQITPCDAKTVDCDSRFVNYNNT